jgi:hypothetical protein
VIDKYSNEMWSQGTAWLHGFFHRVKTIEYTFVVKTEKVAEEVQCFLEQIVL